MTGRAALVTGANSGIGLATVLELARRGYQVTGTVRSQAKAETVTRAAADAGVRVETALLDVTDAEQCAAVVGDRAWYALVNNAGYAVAGAIEDIAVEDGAALLETMAVAPMRLARLVLPAMRAAGEGRIVNVSSIGGLVSVPFLGWYAASKHAMEALTDALRPEVAGGGIKVVLVEPGGFKTGVWGGADALDELTESPFHSSYGRVLTGLRFMQRFMGDPGQVAKVVARAVDARLPRARYVVGWDAHSLRWGDRLMPTPAKDRFLRLLARF